jgi:transposase
MATTTRRRASAAHWAERVQRWQQSGLTAEHFSRREGLDPRQLRWWKWSLGKRTAPGEGASVTSFLPVRVVAAAPTAAPSAVEIVLGNGRRVRVLGPVDADVLAAVLEAAERA